VLRIVRGNPAPEQIAALVAVLAARSAAVTDSSRPAPAGWVDRAYALRAPTAPGPGAWRASAWPR
jgi:acyl-CoA carboxylase epsilon subunit